MAEPVAEPVSVTVAVPVSGDETPIEVTITVTARRVHDASPMLLDAQEPGDEAPAEPAPPARPSAVIGGGRIQGVRQAQ